MSAKQFQEFTDKTTIPTKKQNRKLKKLVNYAKTHISTTFRTQLTLRGAPAAS